MKKLGAVLAIIGLLVTLAACGAAPSVSSTPAPSALSGAPTTSGNEHVAFLAREDQQNSVLGTEVWSAISLFAGEEGIANSLYTVTNDDALATAELAIKSGANAIVMMGNDMLEAVNKGRVQHPDVYFLLIDAKQTLDAAQNAAQIEISYGQAGWLAGYAAVMDGYTKLAYFQTDVQEVQQRALGFVLGAEAAAETKGLGSAAIQIIPLSVTNADNFSEWRTAMSAAYGNGIQAIFANENSLRATALAAAKAAQGKIIDVADVASAAKQKSDLVLTTVVQGVYNTVYGTLASWKNGPQPAKGVVYSGISEGDISLVMESAGFTTFNQMSYQELQKLFENAELTAQILEKTLPSEEGVLPLTSQLGLIHVQIGYPQSPDKQNSEPQSGSDAGSAEGQTPPVEPEAPPSSAAEATG